MAIGRLGRFLFLILTGLFWGCGHTLVSNEQLQSESENRETMAAQMTALQTEVRQNRADKTEMIAQTKKREKEIDARMEEAMLQLRLIQGNLEKSDIRRSEEAHQTELTSTQQGKMTATLRAETEGQVGAVRSDVQTIQQALDVQRTGMAELSKEVAALKESLLPALAAQTQRVDALEEQGQKSRRGDAVQVNKRLDQFSKTLDQLGEKVFTKFDEQDKLLRKTGQRLDAIESRTGAKP
jgi:hypothetical protein